MKKYILLVHFLFITYGSFSQTVIQMKKEGGVSIIPCKVNGLSLSFIFDTGASEVTLSLTEAKFMLKNGYLSKNDILGTSKYSDANGDISEGININIREIEIQGLKLYNVKAAIVKNMEAPLLLGQTAISKLGVFQLDLISNTLTILSNSSSKNVMDFNNSNFNTCIDIDGNIYKTVKIGSQTWMAENLNVEHFQNGYPIQEAKTNEEWKKAGENNRPAWCYYNFDPINGEKYGKLYNWYAINDSRRLTPKEWHVPSDNEWKELEKYLVDKVGYKMKSTIGWDGDKYTEISSFCDSCYLWSKEDRQKKFCNLCNNSGYTKIKLPYFNNSINGSNSSGFSALPGGWIEDNGIFSGYILEVTSWWTTTEYIKNQIFTRGPNNITGELGGMNVYKMYGCYVRCLLD